jgi:hypothetical protein
MSPAPQTPTSEAGSEDVPEINQQGLADVRRGPKRELFWPSQTMRHGITYVGRFDPSVSQVAEQERLFDHPRVGPEAPQFDQKPAAPVPDYPQQEWVRIPAPAPWPAGEGEGYQDFDENGIPWRFNGDLLQEPFYVSTDEMRAQRRYAETSTTQGG